MSGYDVLLRVDFGYRVVGPGAERACADLSLNERDRIPVPRQVAQGYLTLGVWV
jgi:hypothetical protein